MIEVKNISKSFGEKNILDDISFNINEGDSVAIIGQSGVGKSVILKHINGLLRPNQGNIVIDESTISNLSFNELQKVAENKKKVTDAFGEFHTDINNNTSGEIDINASYYLFFRFL